MRNRFFETVFTPSVQAEQRRHGSRAAYARHQTDDGPERGATLSAYDIAFVQARDSFYLATVSETGWPHVQHRGGPIGFVRAINSKTLAWVDYVGNRQYVSVGNAAKHDRVAMIFVDYPGRARVKILGRMAWVEAAEHPELISDLIVPDYLARPEHIIQIAVEAVDWNCPQHITPRFTLAEINAGLTTSD